MTGFFIRVEGDDGKPATKDITECSAAELNRFLADRTPDELRGWVTGLVRWIKENVV